MSDFTLVTGDCREAMRAMQPESVDAVVTDPPYGLGFMGKDWDSFRASVHGEASILPAGGQAAVRWEPETFQAWCKAWASEVLRVLKPGGRMLAFGGNRTHHRLFAGIEDAGFLIEDAVMWLYGQGFPKHGSKLKPAYEPICVARKGRTTDLNIDACRVGFESDQEREHVKNRSGQGGGTLYGGGKSWKDMDDADMPDGRWPANVVLDEAAAAMLDEQSGHNHSSGGRIGNAGGGAVQNVPVGAHHAGDPGYGDTGGASRFFYVAKASRAERNRGCEHFYWRRDPDASIGYARVERDEWESLDPKERARGNIHPTVKPLSLAKWLVRLIAPAGGTVLDPFAGSFTIGVACVEEGFGAVLIERERPYADIGEARMDASQPSLFSSANANGGGA